MHPREMNTAYSEDGTHKQMQTPGEYVWKYLRFILVASFNATVQV